MNGGRFHYFNVTVGETDLHIGVNANEYEERIPAQALQLVMLHRSKLKNYVLQQPEFLTSHRPVDVAEQAPEIARLMIKRSVAAEVGPMAAVAGAFAAMIGTQLCTEFNLTELIIENGGDLWMKTERPVTVRIDAGPSSLSGFVGIEVQPELTPCGICTSSGSTGHSFSYGKADAVTVLSECAITADAWATSLCNRIHETADLQKTVSLAQLIPEISGVVAILHDVVAASGNITLKRIENGKIRTD